uniref:SET domain-containing protein n=1 Tax=Arcella intermedia TaxID=1963864 RepID=A0A6B2L5J7_9EUKA
MLLARLLIRFQQDVGSVEEVGLLCAHESAVSPEQLSEMQVMAGLAKSLLPPALSEAYTIQQLVHYLCIFKCNNYNICNEDMVSIGIGLYPAASVFNHSCRPNVGVVFSGRSVMLKALRPLQKGEELCISYIELGRNRASRRKDLKEGFNFDCECSLCSDGTLDSALSVDHTKHEALMNQLEALTEQALSLKQNSELKKSLEMFLKIAKQLREISPPIGYELLSTYDSIVQLSLQLQDWTTAKEYLILSTPICEKIYADISPNLGLHYYTLGKLSWFMEDDQRAYQYLLKAHNILDKIYPSTSNRLQTLNNLLNEVQAYRKKTINQSG